ncbi:MAG: glycosyltransferase family 9 protein [Burkholderiales bacterium]
MNLPFADDLLYRYVSWRAATPTPLFDATQLPSIRRVLLMLTTGLGDAILSTPVFPAIRAALPEAWIGLFCRTAWAPLFASDPNLNEVIPYFGKYRHFFPTVASLRSHAPDLVVILHGNDPDIVPLAYLSGARHVVRVPTRGTRYEFLLANRGRAQDAQIAPDTHYVENRLRVLHTLGIPATSNAPGIVLDESRTAAATRRLAERLGGAPYWVLHSNAADPYKVWPGEKQKELIGRARRLFPRHAVVLTGTANEAQGLNALVTNISGTHVVAGEHNVLETAAVLAGAACVLAPDTGILHLAAALDRPTIGLYAPTYSNLIGPRSRSAVPINIQKARTCDPCSEKQCPYTPKNCMDQISVDEVLGALTPRLEVA